MSAQTLAALSVAERISAIEDEVLKRWPKVTVEPRPDAGVVHVSCNGARCAISVAFTGFKSGNVLIHRQSSQPSHAQSMFVEGSAQHVANEVSEALEEFLGPRQDTP